MLNIIKKNKKNILITILLTILINLLSNSYYLISLFNKTKPITYNENNIIKEENSYIIENINSKINIIKINFNKIPDNIIVSYTSTNFKNYTHYNQNYKKEKNINNDHYIISGTKENIKNLKIDIENGNINNITINPNIKYNLNIINTIITFFIILTSIILLKSKSKLNFKNIKHTYIIILTLIILICLSFGHYISYKKIYTFGDIYEKSYVDAVMNKTLELDLPISSDLAEDSNPYDTSNRHYLYYWDTSFYNGKYYCYFGIWPILSLFIPYKLITKTYLTTPTATFIYSIFAIIGTYLIFKEIIKKYFKNIQLKTYIISFLYIIMGSKLFWCMYRPSFYELTSISAFAHITFGLYLTLFSENKIKNFIGYFLLATAVLCRPTSLLLSILIIPKIINKIKKKQFNFKDFILLCIPYITVGLFTMYINYIRFDSIFEFGISYQLTTNNLSNNSFSIVKCIYGIYYYLFNKINISLFPLKITDQKVTLSILGDLNIEKLGGGLFATSILSIIIIFIPKIFKFIKEKELKKYIIISLILSLTLIGLSSGIGAIIGRYMLDFNYLIYLITVILCLYTINHYNNNNKITNIYYILTIISIIINLIFSLTADI